MRVKRVNRYYCDFCDKGGYSAGHMKKHELHCTANPDRTCRMCKALDQNQPDLKPAIELLPDPGKLKTNYSDEFGEWTRYDGLLEALKVALPKIRDILDECPVCMYSALRRRGLFADGQLYGLVREAGFDFKGELQATWAEINDEATRRDHGY